MTLQRATIMGLPPLPAAGGGAVPLQHLPLIPLAPGNLPSRALPADALHLSKAPAAPAPSAWLQAYRSSTEAIADVAAYGATQVIRYLPRIAGGLPAEVPSFRHPLTGAWQSSRFGWRVHPITHRRSFHAGIDLAAPAGTPIRAAASGKARLVPEKDSGGYGNLVILDHGNGYTSRYGHASRFLARNGAWVQAGQPIALVGSTGVSTGPHLHFEVRYRGTAQDPKPFIGFASGEYPYGFARALSHPPPRAG